MTSHPVEISGILIHETADAYLIDAGLEENVWLPKSQTQHEPGSRIFTLPEWFAKKKVLT